MPMTLKAARINKGFNLDEASAIIGVSKQTLCKWEKGKTFPDVPNIKKIEVAYGLPYSDIIFLPNEFNLIRQGEATDVSSICTVQR